MTKKTLCDFGVDLDAVAGWLVSYGGEGSPDNILRDYSSARSARRDS